MILLYLRKQRSITSRRHAIRHLLVALHQWTSSAALEFIITPMGKGVCESEMRLEIVDGGARFWV